MSKTDQILKASLNLFSAQGIDGTGTAQIAKEANVAKGTIFHHFQNKNILIEELYKMIKRELLNSLGQIDEDDLLLTGKMFWMESVEFFVNNPKKLIFLKMYYSSPHVSPQRRVEMLHEIGSKLIEMYELGMENNIIKKLPIDYLVQLSFDNTTLTALYIMENKELSKEEFKESCFETFMKGILRN